jgi:imidazolonepropionase-like amidohydrolase
MEAIVAATKYGAMACFMGHETGTVEPGKLADIIIVDGDPLADIRVLQDVDKIRVVMLEGKVEIDRRLPAGT